MIRQRLKEADLKITELADYLHLTRPTLYKYIESYDGGDKDSINKKVLKLFKYIEENTLAGKKTIVNYILTNLVEEVDLDDSDASAKFTKVKKVMLSDPESNKTQLINIIANKKTLDDVVDYLLIVDSLVKKRKLTPEEEKMLKPYNDLLEAIEKENE